MIDGKFTIPGKFIGTSEEYSSGEGTYDKNGKVYSSIIGTIEVNEENKFVKVIPSTSVPPVPKNKDEILGTVRRVKDSIALVNIDRIVGNVYRESAADEVGAIHISNVSDDYVENLSDYFKSGDIIKAKVIVEKPGAIDLATNEPQLGVLSAKCEECNGRLKRKEKTKLICRKCENVENRKISSDFGKGIR